MKISKLFHWLYAILMFLPILVFIPNAFYYGFNETAVAQEKTELIPVYYESNEVSSVSDLVNGNYYHFSYSILDNLTFVFFVDEVQNVFGDFVSNQQLSSYGQTPYLRGYQNTTFYVAYENLVNNSVLVYNYSLVELDFLFNSAVVDSSTLNTIISHISKCNNLYVKDYQPLTTNMSITDSMSYAWKSTWQNDLFSWSYGSFLTQPFLYITNLFNVPATNTLLYCLSYWLNISIIWLCFDVVMYVPLLVHRWLDKGIVE